MEEQFRKYTQSFQKYGPKIDLKIDHTVRVKELCVEIAKSLNLSTEEVNMASNCGLLHDIGRFEQWKKYKTYNDSISIDHGDFGVEILKKEGFLSPFTKKDQNTLLKVVKYHNKYKVPNTINETNKLFINITRDADKIDILQLFAKGDLVFETDNTQMTDKVFQTLLSKKLISNKDIKTKADAIGVRIGFIFDINYKKSFEILKEKNYLNQIIEKQIKETNNLDFKNQLKELKQFSNQYIEERIIC